MSVLEKPKSQSTVREEVRCAFCQGHGTDPYGQLSELSVCASCGGRGVVAVTVPHVSCAYCSGSGSYKTYRCSVCEGAGVVPTLDGPTKTCPSCGGLAYEQSNGLVCLTCHGRGIVQV